MRRDLTDKGCPYREQGVAMEVSVDWSISGIDASVEPTAEDYVHRVSFRFFPTDGSAPFDRYLEGAEISAGKIYVPEGEYSLVVFNESIEDTYWHKAIEFENCDNYNLFSARLVDDVPDAFTSLTVGEGERQSAEALKLASASFDNIVISAEEPAPKVLNPVVLRPLTCTTTISAEVENLASAYLVYSSLTGLAHRVFFATGDTDEFSTTHITPLTERTWSDEQQLHGVISTSRLTFTTPAVVSKHTLELDVILTDGTRHEPLEPLFFDVTDQILNPTTTRYADSDLSAKVSFSLPETKGEVEVDDWGDSEQITIR